MAKNIRCDIAASCLINAQTSIVPASEKAKKTDLFRPDGEDDFWVRSRSQVLAVLSRMRNRTTPVTAYFDGDQKFILTAVLGLLKERDLLILDEGPSEKLNVKLLRSGRAGVPDSEGTVISPASGVLPRSGICSESSGMLCAATGPEPVKAVGS